MQTRETFNLMRKSDNPIQDTYLITMVKGNIQYMDVRLCIMELLAHNINVGIKKVEPVIRAVLKFADVICQKLPQPTTISDMLLEGRVLSQIQLVEALTLFTLMVLQNLTKVHVVVTKSIEITALT